MSESPQIMARRVDQVKVFHLFTFFGGDIKRTAAAAHVDERIVFALAHDFDWMAKIGGRNRLDTDDGLEEERKANRAANYSLGMRFRDVLESVVLDAENDSTFARALCVVKDKEGNETFTPKPLVEVAKALEIANNITYRALGDKLAEAKPVDPATGEKVGNLAVHIYQRLSSVSEGMKKVEEAVPIVSAAARVVDAVEAAEARTPVADD